jgi:hypothetical protein
MLFLASLLAEDISKFKGCKIVNRLKTSAARFAIETTHTHR